MLFLALLLSNIHDKILLRDAATYQTVSEAIIGGNWLRKVASNHLMDILLCFIQLNTKCQYR
jgi:hypothetical protein